MGSVIRGTVINIAITLIEKKGKIRDLTNHITWILFKGLH